MKRLSSFLLLALLVSIAMPATARAAKPIRPTQPKDPIGYDISYPQCGRKLPTDQAFGIVGVNGGTAATFNPCLVDQLRWANKSIGGTVQPKIQLYVNTANPAQDNAYTWASWPTSSTANNPYGTCSGERTNDLACSWQYGWNRSIEAEKYFTAQAQLAGISTNASDYTWWLDVETMNSWQSGSTDALARNTAAIEGFAAYYQAMDSPVGLYSTAYQWNEIVGSTVRSDSNLNGLPNWRPSGSNLTNAKANCFVDPLTPGGFIAITQYVQKNLDKNYSCQ